MSSELQLDVRHHIQGGDIWWTLTKERQAWCNLQVNLCDPCFETKRCTKALYKYSFFPFIFPLESYYLTFCGHGRPSGVVFHYIVRFAVNLGQSFPVLQKLIVISLVTGTNFSTVQTIIHFSVSTKIRSMKGESAQRYSSNAVITVTGCMFLDDRYDEQIYRIRDIWYQNPVICA